MPDKVSITKPNTVETFMKANTDLRISADTLKEFQTRLDDLAGSITKEAEKQAKSSGRTTIMPADIKAAMTAVVGSTSDVSYLFSQLEKLSAKDTATIPSACFRQLACVVAPNTAHHHHRVALTSQLNRCRLTLFRR